MIDGHFLGAQGFDVIVWSITSYMAMGIGLAFIFFILGYVLYFLIDLFKGGSVL